MTTLPALLEQIERIGQHCAADDFSAAEAALAELDRALRAFTPSAAEAAAAWGSLQNAHQCLVQRLKLDRDAAGQALQALREGVRSRQAYLSGRGTR
jgi:predicted component of type VI protein secretion system